MKVARVVTLTYLCLPLEWDHHLITNSPSVIPIWTTCPTNISPQPCPPLTTHLLLEHPYTSTAFLLCQCPEGPQLLPFCQGFCVNLQLWAGGLTCFSYKGEVFCLVAWHLCFYLESFSKKGHCYCKLIFFFSFQFTPPPKIRKLNCES